MCCVGPGCRLSGVVQLGITSRLHKKKVLSQIGVLSHLYATPPEQKVMLVPIVAVLHANNRASADQVSQANANSGHQAS